jgi:hypothetical protein
MASVCTGTFPREDAEQRESGVAGASSIQSVLSAVADRAGRSGAFAGVEAVSGGNRVDCAALSSAAPSWYRVVVEGDRVFVELVMADRWLSHSIEADLLNTGDKMEELLEEELVELGVRHAGREVGALTVEHFRSEDKLFTFRSRLPGVASELDPETIAGCLLAYEACFRNLGDMATGGGDED